MDFGTAEKIVEKLLFIAALSSTLIVFFIIAFMFKEGIPALALGGDFFFGMIWSPSHNQYGIVPLVVCTFIVGIGALVLAGQCHIDYVKDSRSSQRRNPRPAPTPVCPP